MFHVDLFSQFMFFYLYEKGLLNFVSESFERAFF